MFICTMVAIFETAIRTFGSEIFTLLKGGLSLTAVAPVVLLVLVAFSLFKAFFGDSPYSPYAKNIALTAASVWDRRNELGLYPNIRGKTLASMEPLTEVLDALVASVQKYESSSTPNLPYSKNQSSRLRFQ